MQHAFKTDLLRLLRAAGAYLFVAALGAAIAGLILIDLRRGNVVENGLVETAQLLALAAAAIVYGTRARLARGGLGPARALAMCSLVVLAMCIRELDGFFDKLLWHGSWAAIDLLVLAAFLAIPAVAPERTVRELADFARSQECALLVVGIAFAVVFSQLLGYKVVWAEVFDLPIWQDAAAPFVQPDGRLPGEVDIPRHVKNTVEESFELASYLLVLASALLPPLVARRDGPRDRQTV